MAISKIAQGAVAAATDATPSLSQGDILIVFAYRSNSATAPTKDAAYTQIATIANSGGGTNGSMISGYRVAGVGGFTGAGTWTNATHLAWIHLRGVGSTPVGNSGTSGGNNAATSINYAAVASTSGQNGLHWFVGFDGRTTGGANVAVAPSGMTNHASVPATPVVGVHSTNATAAGAWSSTTVADTGFKTCTLVVEVLSTIATSSTAGPGSYALTGAAATDLRDVPSTGGAGSYAVTGAAGTDIRNVAASADPGTYTTTGAAATSTVQRPSTAGPGSYATTGASANDGIASSAGPGTLTITGAAATSTAQNNSTADPGTYAATGAGATANRAVPSSADPGSYATAGADATDRFDSSSTGSPGSYALTGAPAIDGVGSQAGAGTYTVTGTPAGVGLASLAEPGEIDLTGADGADDVASSATPGGYALTGAPATGESSGGQAIVSSADPGSYGLTGFYATAEYSGGTPGLAADGASPIILRQMRRNKEEQEFGPILPFLTED